MRFQRDSRVRCQCDIMPYWFAGCGMLVAGGFCYGRLVDES